MKYCEPCAKLIAQKINRPTIAMIGEFVEKRTCDYCKTPNVRCAGIAQTVRTRLVMRKQRGFAIPLPIMAFLAKWGIWMIVGAVVIASVTVAVKYYNESLRETGRKEIQAKWDAAIAEQAEKERAQSATASTNLEADRVKTRTVYRTITKSVDKYIDRPIYRNVCVDADGVRDANAALRKTAPADTGKPDAAVPAADGARERAGRDGIAKTD